MKVYRFPVDLIKGDDLSQFRVEQARFRRSWYFLVSTVVSVTGYGWTLAHKVVCIHPAQLWAFESSLTLEMRMLPFLYFCSSSLAPRSPAYLPCAVLFWQTWIHAIRPLRKRPQTLSAVPCGPQGSQQLKGWLVIWGQAGHSPYFRDCACLRHRWYWLKWDGALTGVREDSRT